MNTPTHILAAAAILARPDAPKRNIAVAVGALAPDISIYVFFAAMLAFTDLSMGEIWGEAYWTEPWQSLGAISNSVPLALALAVCGWWRRWPLVSVFASAMLIHAALDFPVHADDAHRHFWPITQWRYQSPISYWDLRHGGLIGPLSELVIAGGSIVLLWRRFPGRWFRLFLGAVALVYLAMAGAVVAFS